MPLPERLRAWMQEEDDELDDIEAMDEPYESDFNDFLFSASCATIPPMHTQADLMYDLGSLVSLLKDAFEGGGARCVEPEEVEEVLSYLGIIRGVTGRKGEEFLMTTYGQELLDAYKSRSK